MRSTPSTPLRRLAAGLSTLAVSVAGIGLGTGDAGAAATPAHPLGIVAADLATPVTITSATLEVQLSPSFPQVLGYRDLASGAVLGGQPEQLTSVLLNGVRRAVTASVSPGATSAAYTLEFPDLPGVLVELGVAVKGSVLTWQVTRVDDSDSVTVNTLSVPGLDLVSVSSTQPGATSAFNRLDTDATRTSDVIAPLTDATAVQSNPVGATYGILNTSHLAASVETNGTYDKPSGAAGTTAEGGRLWHRVQANGDGTKRVGITPGEWTIRGAGAPDQSELPWARVVVTGDANRDAKVDWQDGAIAFRTIGYVPEGADEVRERVVQRIPFNFGSLATHPFLRTLDDTKRLAAATDGLGQFALLKGYASEGHDSAHPDYGGNYNEGAGGLKDLNVLLEEGKKWGADFGVHVNATEAYPEAKAFSEELVDRGAKGWNWLNQSYYIDQRRDLNTNALLERTQQLREETKGNLDLLYWDVYYSYGWIPDEMASRLRAQGWELATEFTTNHERNAIWTHWATDRDYGPITNKGINSQIIRFVRNGQKDVWNPDPVLGGSQIVDAEGWTGEKDWNVLMRNVWTRQLPTKFLQHFDILKWDTGAGASDIAFTGAVRGTTLGGTRKLSLAGATVLDGDAYLLPWGQKTPLAPQKAYHYNADGGSTTWRLTPALRGVQSFTLYELSEAGRTAVGTITPTNGSVTLTAKADTAYVLYPDKAPAQIDPQYGEGGPLADPGFNAAGLDGWQTAGTVTQERLATGQRVAQLGAGSSSLGQQVTGLEPGRRYAASAWVQVEPGATRTASVRVTGDDVDATNTITRSTARNHVASDELRGTYFQRLRVIFTAPANGTATLTVEAGDGTAPVQVDDLRIVPIGEEAPSGDVIARQDFEGLDQGWLPFVSGPAHGGGDARTHVAVKHAPYTQAGWNGKLVDDVLGGERSLKAHEEATGIVYRSWLGTIPFQAGRRYRVEFDYQNATGGAYSFVSGVDQTVAGAARTAELSAVPFGQQRTTAHFEHELSTGTCGDYFVGIRRHGVGGSQADFILDDLTITDLGATEEPAACARLEITAPPGGLVPGETNTVTTSFTNSEASAATAVTARLTAPDGWTVSPAEATHASVAPGATARATWRVTVPAGTTTGSHTLTGTATYTVNGGARTVSGTARVSTLPPGLVPQSRLAVAGVSDTEPGTGDGSPRAAIDGNAATMWHSAYSQVSPDAPYPHWITLDLGDVYDVDGYDYQVRVGNGAIKGYEIYVSTDNATWGAPVKTGTFASTSAVQHVAFPARRGRYVKLVGLSSINGAVFGGANELNVWGTRVADLPAPLAKSGMSIASVDSQETAGENGAATNVLDDDPTTIWHTAWSTQQAPYPHHVAVDLGATRTLSAISIQGRPGTELNGRIKDYQVFVSTDGTTWGSPVAQGTLTGASSAQTVMFGSAQTARFVKVVGLNAINGLPFASIAELQFYAAG